VIAGCITPAEAQTTARTPGIECSPQRVVVAHDGQVVRSKETRAAGRGAHHMFHHTNDLSLIHDMSTSRARADSAFKEKRSKLL
jgi:hypothetical protein